MPQVQLGYVCVGGSRAGQNCASNATLVAAKVHEVTCPGGACLSATRAASTDAGTGKLWVIIGAIVMIFLCLAAVAVKLERLRREKAAEKEEEDRDLQLAMQMSQEETDFRRALQASLDPFNDQQPREPLDRTRSTTAGDASSRFNFRQMLAFSYSNHPWLSMSDNLPAVEMTSIPRHYAV